MLHFSRKRFSSAPGREFMIGRFSSLSLIMASTPIRMVLETKPEPSGRSSVSRKANASLSAGGHSDDFVSDFFISVPFADFPEYGSLNSNFVRFNQTHHIQQ